MITLKLIYEIWANLETVNRVNGVEFSARFLGNYIFIDKSEDLITSYFCRIEYSEPKDLFKVQYYNFRKNQFEPSDIKFRRESLASTLEIVLLKDISRKY